MLLRTASGRLRTWVGSGFRVQSKLGFSGAGMRPTRSHWPSRSIPRSCAGRERHGHLNSQSVSGQTGFVAVRPVFGDSIYEMPHASLLLQPRDAWSSNSGEGIHLLASIATGRRRSGSTLHMFEIFSFLNLRVFGQTWVTL